MVAGPTNIDYAGLTDVGVRRSHNQDSFSILTASDHEQWIQRGHLFVVADGMGAHAVGELASKLAADSIPHLYSKHAREGPIAALRRAFIESNSNIHNRGQQNREFEGMGTTGTALLLRPEGAWLGHVGDSRVYRVRGDRIEQLSFDHSLRWEMAQRQNCDPDDLQGIPPNVIVRSLGPEPLVKIDIEGPHSVEPGDIFVVCSDGLSGPVTDEEIAAVVSVLPPEEACRLLIDMANLHGGPDNITAIVVRIGNEPVAGSDQMGSWIGTLLPKGNAWYDRIPWPLLSLVFGIGLAIVAIFLTVYEMPGNFAAFLFAAIAMLVGLGGVLIQFRQDSSNPFEELLSRPPPEVYRSRTFTIERSFVEKLTKAIGTLNERISDFGITADLETCQKHYDQAKTMQQDNRFPDAYREACRALRVLTDSISKQNAKSESFKPLWDTRAE